MDRSGLAPYPSVAELEAIIAGREPVLRNLRLTQGYHELSTALASAVGFDNANWCTFGCWASKTAGMQIRGEELPAVLRPIVLRDPRRWKGRPAAARGGLAGLAYRWLGDDLLVVLAEQIAARVSDLIAAGNLKIFSEITPAYSRFLDTFAGASRPDPALLEPYLATLRPGPPEHQGQELLARAFRAYAAAASATVPKERAEALLLGNLLIGLHEQTRLQDQIEAALEAPAQVSFSALMALRLERRVPQLGRLPLERLLRPLAGPFQRAVTDEWRRDSTEWLMQLRMAGETFELGADLPALPGRPLFPADLQEPANPELVELLGRLTPGARPVPGAQALPGSAARDWASLSDRMRYIADLFRSRQQHRPILDEPFSPAQLAAIRSGRVPVGDGPL